MVIFVVPPTTCDRQRDGLQDGPHVTIAALALGMGGLDEPHAARNSQDASSQRSVSEAWIADEEGSIDVH